MDTAEFFDLVEGFFGGRATAKGFDTASAEFTATLFTTFFGRGVSLNSDKESILTSLQIVDEWCRLHLPEKFLERYDAAIC
jgi:hypothetical protein